MKSSVISAEHMQKVFPIMTCMRSIVILNLEVLYYISHASISEATAAKITRYIESDNLINYVILMCYTRQTKAQIIESLSEE